jgi:hypothetical protein
MDPWFLIILERATDQELEAVQAIAKAHSEDWWHEIENVWIVRGQTATYWLTLITPVIPHGNSGAFVFRLPDEAAWEDFRSYAISGRERTSFVRQIYGHTSDDEVVETNPRGRKRA